MTLDYDHCPTCKLGWWFFPPTKIDNVDAVRCVECKAVYPIAAPSPGEQKPVAWRWRAKGSNGSHTFSETEPVPHPDYLTEPLYTSPPPAAGWDEALITKLSDAYDKVKLWPENRIDGGVPEGFDDIFGDFLELPSRPDAGGGVRADERERLIAFADYYLANNAAENGTDELIRQLRDALAAVKALRREAPAPEGVAPTHIDSGGRAVIEGGDVVIRFPLDAMQSAIDGAWSLKVFDTRYKITNIDEFSKEFVYALNREDERGTTNIHRLADKAFIDCIESGAFGIEEHEQQKI